MILKALSIRQPWGWAILHAGKTIENRDWNTKVRGTIALHVGKTYDQGGASWIEEAFGVKIPENLPLGGIVGTADLVDVIEESDSPWFFGRFGLVLKNPKEISFISMRGMLGFFPVEIPSL